MMSSGEEGFVKRRIDKRTDFIGRMALYTALATLLGALDFILPIPRPVPGFKLGLANLVILVLLEKEGGKPALAVSVIRVFIGTGLFLGIGTMLYSLSGALLSLLVMFLARKMLRIGILTTSILGGITHNMAQLLVASIVLNSPHILAYGPVLFVTGFLTGFFIGILVKQLLTRLRI